jgi:hypothetical protein
MNKVFFLGFFIGLLGCPASAEKVARVSMRTLQNEANLIAIVKVESASLLEGKCGVKYSVLVVDPVKNTTRGARIFVSDRYLRSAGLRVGKTFVLFENEDRACGPVVSHAGYGAFAIEAPLLIDYDAAVRIPSTYVESPAGLSTRDGQRRDEESTEVQWVDLKAFLQWLKESKQ